MTAGPAFNSTTCNGFDPSDIAASLSQTYFTNSATDPYTYQCLSTRYNNQTGFAACNARDTYLCIGQKDEQHACAAQNHCHLVDWPSKGAIAMPCTQPLVNYLRAQNVAGVQTPCCGSSEKSCTAPETDSTGLLRCSDPERAELQLCVVTGDSLECVSTVDERICSWYLPSKSGLPPAPGGSGSGALSRDALIWIVCGSVVGGISGLLLLVWVNYCENKRLREHEEAQPQADTVTRAQSQSSAVVPATSDSDEETTNDETDDDDNHHIELHIVNGRRSGRDTRRPGYVTFAPTNYTSQGNTITAGRDHNVTNQNTQFHGGVHYHHK